MHDPACAALYVPAVQLKQAVDPGGAYVPMAHVPGQELDIAAVLYCPPARRPLQTKDRKTGVRVSAYQFIRSTASRRRRSGNSPVNCLLVITRTVGTDV